MLRGELWRLSLGSDPQRKQGGNRLVVLLSNDALAVLPLRIVVPLTPWEESYRSAPWMVYVPPVLRSGLESAQAADTLQIRSVAKGRLIERVGELPEKLVDEIAAAAELVIHKA
jgi:mRNA interferase MazF